MSPPALESTNDGCGGGVNNFNPDEYAQKWNGSFLEAHADCFSNPGIGPAHHSSQATAHEVGPSGSLNDPAPSLSQALPPSLSSIPSHGVLTNEGPHPQHPSLNEYNSPYPAPTPPLLTLSRGTITASGPLLPTDNDPIHSPGLQSNPQTGEPVDSPHYQGALASNPQLPPPTDSQDQGSYKDSGSYTGLPSPPSSTGRPSPKQQPVRQAKSFGCSGCNQKYTWKSSFNRHLYEGKKCRYGQGGRSFTCYECARPVAGRRSTLKQHLKEVHGMEKQKADETLNVWYQRNGVENDHSEVAEMLGL